LRARFTTFERVQQRERRSSRRRTAGAFERDKLARSIYVALRKRPSKPSGWNASSTPWCANSKFGRHRIPSEDVGELVMEALSTLDKVAYIRFASVLPQFPEAKDFGEFCRRIARMTKLRVACARDLPPRQHLDRSRR